MTILLMEGFDLYNGTDATTGIAANWLLDNYYASLSTPAGRFGGKCFCTVWGGSVQYSLAYRPLAAQTSAFSFGLAIRISDFSESPFVWLLSASRAYQACIRTDSFGNLIACRASSRTSQTDLGKTSAPVLRRNAWHYVEVEGVIGDTGAMRIYVDGAKVLDLSGVDTQQQATSQIGMIQLGYVGSSATYYFDDLYVTDTDHRLGERKITVLTLTADVAKAFTPSTGTANYACLDDAVLDVSDYVTATDPGTTDTYELSDLVDTPSVIDAIQLTAMARKTDASTRALALQVVSGATSDDGPSFYLSSTFTVFSRLLSSDPATGTAWTPASVNALRAGPKVAV
jgi:hypothetical protein